MNTLVPGAPTAPLPDLGRAVADVAPGASRLAQDRQDFDRLMQTQDATTPTRPHRSGALHQALSQMQDALSANTNAEAPPLNAGSDEMTAYALRQIERDAQAKVMLEMSKVTLKAATTTVEKVLNQK